MKSSTVVSLAVLCLLPAASAFGQTADGVKQPVNPWLSDFQSFYGRPMEKDAGLAPAPSEPTILSGDCSDYIDLTGMPLPISVAGSTVGATNNYGPFSQRPECWSESWYPLSCAARDVTYKWTAPADGEYTISIAESSYDNCLLLFRFTCPDEPVYPDDFICGNDDALVFDTFGAELGYVHLSEGEEILIVVDGYINYVGNFQLKIYETHISEVSDLDWFIEMQMAAFHVPGLAACAVKDGQVDWTGHYGDANIASHIEVADTTLFVLASVSKVVTGTAIMQLWEDGLFGLDDDINGYLSFSVRNPSHPSEPITFRMLMTHTSSISDYWPTFNALRSWGQDTPIPLGRFVEEYLTPGGDYWNADNFNSWAPGQNFDYSNAGVALSAYLLEVISPDYDSFAQYCNENLFTPLGMDETSWYLADLDANNIAMPYRWDGSAFIPWGHYCDPWFPSASLRTSTLQLARFLIAYLQHGQIDGVRILDSTTVDLMTSVQWPSGLFGLPWGLYWAQLSFGTHLLWGHGGSYIGARTGIVYCPQENTGVIVLTNGESDYPCWTIVDHLLDYEDGPPGFVAGVARDQSSDAMDRVFVKLVDFPRWDYSNADGEYAIGGISTGTYDISFTHPGYLDETVQDVTVTLGETTYVDITMQSLCEYTAGDCNHNGVPLELGDVIAMIGIYRGTEDPQYTCPCPPHGNDFAPEADPNGNCVSFELGDVVAEIGAYRGTAEASGCPDCPGARRLADVRGRDEISGRKIKPDMTSVQETSGQ